MAIVTAGSALDMSTLDISSNFTTKYYNEVDNPTTRAIRFWHDAPGPDGSVPDFQLNYTRLIGENLKISYTLTGGVKTAGTVNRVEVVPDGTEEITIKGVNMPLKEFYGYVTRTDGTGTEAFLQKVLAGNDTIIGSSSSDVLRGISGADTFVFNAPLDATTNVDTITDFSTDDTIHLDDLIFTGLGTGTTAGTALGTGMFTTNAEGEAVGGTQPQIVYETDTGRLLYDVDGVGAGAAVQFATLVGNPVLNAGQIEII